MAHVKLTQSLRDDYEHLFMSCIPKAEKKKEVDDLVNGLMEHKDKYEDVAGVLDVPWFFVAIVHKMESDQNFKTHLHNGDPLTARTIKIPKGRPLSGSAPFNWEASAEDALRLQGLDRWEDWSIPGLLYKLEAYNGFGYRIRHPEVLTPYLWSFSQHYTTGKFVSDGTFSRTAVSKQCGGAVLLRRMSERNLIDFAGADAVPSDEPLLRYSKTGDIIPHAIELQRLLNTFPSIHVAVDGQPGDRTSDAFKKVFGNFLVGDPRASN